jgi:hypothetical protein
MDNSDQQIPQPIINNDVQENKVNKKEELKKLEEEYLTSQKLFIEKKRKIDEIKPSYDSHQRIINSLDSRRYELNDIISQERRYVKETEANLVKVRLHLEKNENEVDSLRRSIDKARRQAKPITEMWKIAVSEYKNAENLFKSALEKYNNAKQAEGKDKIQLQRDKNKVTEIHKLANPINTRNNPWLSGSFYLIGFVVVFGVGVGLLIFLVKLSIPWYLAGLIFFASIIVLTIIGAFQLKNDHNLSEKNFIKLMTEAIKQFPSFIKSWLK